MPGFKRLGAGGPYPIEVIVAEILARVEESRLSLRAVMDEYFNRKPYLRGAKDLARAYAAGVLRSFKLVDELARHVIGVETSKMDAFRRNLLRALVYEARFRRVEARRVAGVASRYGLRMELRDVAAIRATGIEELVRGRGEAARLAVLYSQPEWVVEYFLRLLGRREAIALLKAFNRRPVTWLRVNTLKVSVGELERRLRRRGIVVERDEHLPFMLKVVEGAVSPTHVPEHERGFFYVQDKASALAAYCLGPGGLVADLTAAPGGKASLIHQLWGAEVVAIELRWRRALITKRLMGRLGAWGVHVVNADSTRPPLRLRLKRVIVDPDCSSLGRLGHSPEIRLWVSPEMMHRYAAEQRRLLQAAYELLERGGEAVYSTCTLTLEENEENVVWAREVLGFELVEAEPKVGLPGLMGLRYAQRLYPHLHETVGFFIARLRKP